MLSISFVAMINTNYQPAQFMAMFPQKPAPLQKWTPAKRQIETPPANVNARAGAHVVKILV